MRINSPCQEMLLEHEKRMGFNTEKLNINISDDAGFAGLKEIITELEKLKHQSSTQAMSNHALFLQGKKEMLRDIIKYLRRVAK